MKFKFLLAPALLLSACGRSDHQNVNQFPSDLTSREAVAYPPARRPEATKTPGSPAAPPAPQPILRAEVTAQAKPPTPQEQVRESSKSEDPLENQPLPIFEISSLPPRDTSNETEYAPMEEEVEIPNPKPPIQPPPTRTPRPAETRTPPVPVAAPRQMEKQLLDLINAERARQGIAPLKLSRAQSKGNAQCMGSAGHSELMAQSQRLSHDNFPRNICLRSDASAENVGYATGDETRALRTIHQSMMNSEGHRANIMSPQYNTVGLGFFYYKGTLWVTQSFLRL